MGSNVAITMLKDVHPFKTTWTVEVKVLQMWKSFSAQTGSSFDMVLADKNVISNFSSYRKRFFLLNINFIVCFYYI